MDGPQQLYYYNDWLEYLGNRVVLLLYGDTHIKGHPFYETRFQMH
jgi:hypothetical protein